MTQISTPASIFEHTMDPTAGYDTTPGHRLDYTANLSANVSIIPYAGRVGHLNASGEWEIGCKADKMPCFFMQSSVPYGHQTTVSPYWKAIGKFPLAALVATGGFELSTTEYDSAETYAISDYLTAGFSNSDQDAGGLLTNKLPADGATALTPPWRGGGTTVTICGQVTAAPETLKNGNTVLRFWTLYFPGSTTSVPA